MIEKEPELAVFTKDLVKNFDLPGGDSVQVLTGLNLKIYRGEFVAIMGPSGSGKSTLVNILSTLETITAGEVNLNGDRLNDLKTNELLNMRRSRSAIIFQNFALIDYLTAFENVLLPLILRGSDHKEAEVKSLEFLEAVDLSDRRDHLPEELSGGEQQRVAIARALAHKPDIIFADEPTGNLDAITGMKIIQLFKDISHNLGITVIIVTHDHKAARETDRIYILQGGKVIEEKSKEIKERTSKKG